MPLVSVIVPAYNAAATIARALESVLHQTFRDFELLVCDDGSTDETPRLLEGYGSRVTTITQPNRGRGSARNRCLAKASGEFIALLDADDWWVPRKLEIQLEAARANPASALYYANSYIVNGSGLIYRTMNGRWHVGHSGHVYPYLLRNNFVPTSTVLVRAQAVSETGPFDETLPRCQDLDWFLRLAARSQFFYINQILSYYDDRTWSTPDKPVDTYAMFLRVLDKARTANPDLALKHDALFVKSYADCHCELAGNCEKAGRPDMAAEHYRRALTYVPKLRVLQWKRALALYGAGRWDDCEAALHQVMEEEPYHVEAHFYLGNVHLARNEAAAAKIEFDLSLYGGYLYQLFPECVNNLGVALARLGELSRARELFEQAAEQQSFYSDALTNLECLRQEPAAIESLRWTKRKVF